VTEDPLRFVVLGRPQGKGSKRALPIRTRAAAATGQRIVLVDSNRKAAPWAAKVSSAAWAAASERVGHDPVIYRGAVCVTFEFYFARPRGHYGVGKNINRVRPSAPEYMATMPDVDKLVRCSLDALTGVLIRDDSQVVELKARKLFGEPERLEARVTAL
jgi:crossover junction endodeoxyribonuclease RusA